MTSKNESISLHKVAKKVFEEATSAALGSPCNTIISFHLKKKFGKDPCEVFVEDSKTFYEGLEEVFGAGAQMMMNLVGASLVKKYGIACSADEFVGFVIKGDEPSKRKLKEILSEVADKIEK